MAFSEDYQSYLKADKDQRTGKLLMMDQSDYKTQHIFFDDNADEDGKCVVDVRDVGLGQPIAYKKFINMYVVKVDPIKAILEPDYFVKLIEQAVLMRDEEIRKIEAGIEDETNYAYYQKQVQQETEWEKFQKLPDSEYLMKSVMPVLYEGIRVLDLERPNVPIEFLAMYLLKN